MLVTNIPAMAVRSANTHESLRRCALQLFGSQGFASTSVDDIARAAGVSQMTFFRHFSTKESVVVSGIFDPVVADAVAAQARYRTPLQRAAGGLVGALAHQDARYGLRTVEFGHRMHLAATTPQLAAALWASGHDTQVAIARALERTGATGTQALAASGAVIGACSATLLGWGLHPDAGHADAVLRDALVSLIRVR